MEDNYFNVVLVSTVQQHEPVITIYICTMASQVSLVINNTPANAGDLKDAGLILGSGISPGGERGNPLQYACLENPCIGEPGGL